MDDLREFFPLVGTWRPTGNIALSSPSPVSLSALLGSSQLRSTWPDQARIPTGNHVSPFEFRIQERQKTRASRPLSSRL